jgi:hypothetical protein
MSYVVFWNKHMIRAVLDTRQLKITPMKNDGHLQKTGLWAVSNLHVCLCTIWSDGTEPLNPFVLPQGENHVTNSNKVANLSDRRPDARKCVARQPEANVVGNQIKRARERRCCHQSMENVMCYLTIFLHTPNNTTISMCSRALPAGGAEAPQHVGNVHKMPWICRLHVRIGQILLFV